MVGNVGTGMTAKKEDLFLTVPKRYRATCRATEGSSNATQDPKKIGRSLWFESDFCF